MEGVIQEANLAKRGKSREFWVYKGREPTPSQLGLGYQYWAEDNYSLFDKGTFPQSIPGKADSNYKTGVKFFELLEKEGIPHHMVRDMGNRKMEINAATIPPDYEWITPGETVCYLIPMEIIFSKWVTPVASLHGRLRRGEEDPAKYGLEKAPENDELIVLYEPKISHSTKIETFDRYQTEVDVPIPVLAGLVGSEPQEVDDLALAVYDVMIKDAEKAGLFIVADGKVEMIMGPDRKIYVGDTGYSWDENRLLWEFPDGSFVDISKQFPRNIYAIRGYKGEITKAKKEFPKDKSRWPDPPLLDDNQIGIMTDANEAVRMAILGEKGVERAVKDVAYKARDELNRLKEFYKRDETGAEI